MVDRAPQAQEKEVTELWHVDFHMSYEPGALAPAYIRCEVSRREPGTGEPHWHMDGLASFEAPALVIPRAGAALIPYLVYHIDEFKRFLTTEHVVRSLSGTSEDISDKVGVKIPPMGTVPVYE